MKIFHEESAVTSRAIPGPALYQITTMPPGTPRAVVGLLHGYADHAARYQHIADAWAENGIGTIAIDMRGHGRATGTRGFCRRFDEFFDDAAELARLVADRGKGAPAFLVGHSFGGLVAASSVLAGGAGSQAWRGLVLSSPFFGLALDVPKVKVIAGRIASRVYPKLALPSGLTGAHVTHDPKRAREYDEDPLSFKTTTARWFRETQKAQLRALAQAPLLTMPLRVFVGSIDPIAKVAAAREFYERAGSKDKEFRLYDGLLHETLNELEWPEVAGDAARWILDRANPPS